MSLYLLFGQYYDWTSFEPEESSLNAQASSSWDWGPVASAAPEQHWDSWGFPVVEPAPEQPASAWSAEALPHQDVPLVPKAASDVVVAPSTPPADAAMHYQQQEAMRLKSCRLEAALQQETPQPPSVDPLIYFAQAQADVPLVIDR